MSVADAPCHPEARCQGCARYWQQAEERDVDDLLFLIAYGEEPEPCQPMTVF